MKQYAAALLALLLLAACAGLSGQPAPPPPPQNTVPTVAYEEPVYQLDTMSQEGLTLVESQEAARYTYQLLSLSVPNLEALSPRDAEIAQRNMDNFNGRMDELMADAVEVGRAMGEDAEEMYEAGDLIEPYYDETSASFYRAGQMVSIRMDNSTYTGGAHPNRYTASLLFDLGAGQFIDAAQIAGVPEDFRTGAAALLLEKAEALACREEF